MPIIFILWCFLVVTNLAVRPIMPIDETRYLSVAWEMWMRHDFLVPYLNGETYSHKPPLLFWLIHASWTIFGVNDWTPRFISPLFALGSTLLSSLVARELWQDKIQVSERAPFILLGTSFWLIFSTLTMFDMLLTFFVLLAIYGLLRLSTSHSWQYVLLIGFAIGGGILSKGPAILLNFLPIALLAPVWLEKNAEFRWRDWYLKIIFAVLIGASLGLAWAIPAGFSGGEAYRNAILFGQTSGRLVKSFAHQLPWYWYIERLPLLLLPWILFKPFWVGITKLNFKKDSGIKFCLAWILPVFVAFSLISGKRIHYLLPLMPAIALLLARTTNEITDVIEWKKTYNYFLFFGFLIAFVLGSLPFLNTIFQWRDDLNNLHPFWGIVLLFILLGLMFLTCKDVKRILIYNCVLSIALPTILAISYFDIQSERFDTKPIAEKIALFQNENQPVAFFTGKYHGQFQFSGRLTQSLVILNTPENVKSWANEHPDGFLLFDSEKTPKDVLFYSHRYRAGELGFIRSQQLLENLDLIS